MSYGAAAIQLTNILTFHRSTIMMDARRTSLATISIESSCVRDLDLGRIIDVFAEEKTCRKHLETCVKYN